jgi:hypothetical protein
VLKKSEAIPVEETDGKGSLVFVFPRLMKDRRIPLHLKLIVHVASSPYRSQTKLCVRKCSNRYLGPGFESRQWQICRFLRSFAQSDDPPRRHAKYECHHADSTRELQNSNRKSLECTCIQRLHLNSPTKTTPPKGRWAQAKEILGSCR